MAFKKRKYNKVDEVSAGGSGMPPTKPHNELGILKDEVTLEEINSIFETEMESDKLEVINSTCKLSHEKTSKKPSNVGSSKKKKKIPKNEQEQSSPEKPIITKETPVLMRESNEDISLMVVDTNSKRTVEDQAEKAGFNVVGVTSSGLYMLQPTPEKLSSEFEFIGVLDKELQQSVRNIEEFVRDSSNSLSESTLLSKADIEREQMNKLKQNLEQMSRSHTEDILYSAKKMYIKRSRTLIHWIKPFCPKSRVTQLLNSSWEQLPIWQKEIYIAQVMGRYGMENSVGPMVNPQLKNMNKNGTNISQPLVTKKRKQQARSSSKRSKRRTGNYEMDQDGAELTLGSNLEAKQWHDLFPDLNL